MSELEMYKHRVFKEYRNKIMEINEHYAGCPYEHRAVPIDACMCDCYIEQIFNMGREAEATYEYYQVLADRDRLFKAHSVEMIRADKLAIENQRLREALEIIAGYKPLEGFDNVLGNASIAKQALEEVEDE